MRLGAFPPGVEEAREEDEAVVFEAVPAEEEEEEIRLCCLRVRFL